MSLWKEYHLAKSIPEALEAAVNAEGPFAFVAGGTDLLLDLQQGRHKPVHTLVDVTAIPELQVLEIRGDRLFIGAGRPLNRIVDSTLVQEHAPALVEACALIGGPQVRNSATLGGNVAHALPAADGTIALMALRAEAEIASAAGQRRVPLGSLFRGPGQSTLEPGELLCGFYLPLREAGQGSAFRRVMRPQGVALPVLNMAAWIHRQDDCIAGAAIAVGPAGPVPTRCLETEKRLRGAPFSTATLEQALDTLLEEVRYRTSPHRASAEYRLHLTRALLEETFEAAWQRTYPSSLSGEPAAKAHLST